MFKERQQHLIRFLEISDLDAIALNAGPSLTYLTGLHFHLMERPVLLFLVPGQQPTIIIPELEKTKLDLIDYPMTSYTYSEAPSQWAAIFSSALCPLELEGKKIGVEPQQLRLLEYNFLTAFLKNAIFPDASQVIANLRAIKNHDEIALMRQAVKIAQDALSATLPLAKIGMSEQELANELVTQLLKHGSDPLLPFSPIIASGPNGANPHAKPSTRKLTVGDLLIIDWGATWQGYASDLTRTLAIGKIDKEYEYIHTIVQQANAAGRAIGRPGVPCAAVDNATREVIEVAGYGLYFTHRTGHGIGMECHENPYIRGDNPQLLEEGMTYTIEPGIYLSGRNGVRIEDDVVATADGSESLSDFKREIIFIE